MPLVRALHGDFLGEWLPIAMADLLVAVMAVGGAGAGRGEIMESWGFPTPRRDTRAETDRALAQLFSSNV